MPRGPGERIKTDRHDAHTLATMYAAGLVSAVAVPDAGVEATRAMVRCREALVEDRVRCKQRVMPLLLSLGLAYRQGAPWTGRFRQWVQAFELPEASRATLETYLHQLDYLSSEIRAQEDRLAAEAEEWPYRDAVKVLKAFRGIGFVTALTLVCELGDIRRFGHPGARMAYLGLVPGERSSGDKSIRGTITKTGNARARKALVSTAWKYTRQPRTSAALRKRQQGVSPEIVSIAWKAQRRLHKRFYALAHRKPTLQSECRCGARTGGFSAACVAKGS